MNHGVMNRRVTGLLLALYPRAWRDRYGAEVASLTEELIHAGETTPLPAGLNLVAGAAVERARALAGSRRALAVTSAAAIVAMVGGAYAVTGSARPGSVPRGLASSNCLVEPPLQVVVPAGVRLRPTAGTPLTGPLQAKAPPGPRALLQVNGRPGPKEQPPQLKDRPGLADRPRPSRRGLAVVTAISPRRPVLIIARSGKVRRARPELGRGLRVLPNARSCLRTPAAAQGPVPGPARKLRVRPPVPVATRVTR